jgi:hypothetical protein
MCIGTESTPTKHFARRERRQLLEAEPAAQVHRRALSAR